MLNGIKLNDKKLDNVSGGKGVTNGSRQITSNEDLFWELRDFALGTYCYYSINGEHKKEQYFTISDGSYNQLYCRNKICWDEQWNFRGTINIHYDIITVKEWDKFTIEHSDDWTDTL